MLAGVNLIVIATLVVMMVVVLAGSRSARAAAARAVHARTRRRREASRLRQVREAGTVREQEYVELRRLAEACNPADARRFDLEGLLDRFASLAIHHKQYMKALELAPEANTLAHRPRSTRHDDIRARRLRHREVCAREAEEIAEDLAAIAELVGLIAQLSVAPALAADLGGEVDRRLADLDHIDRAQAELAAATA
ncbi:MAG TPA: hypothetical protein VGM90_28805 [Kofleriaceae bacterium]|jgi:hypothetical protein